MPTPLRARLTLTSAGLLLLAAAASSFGQSTIADENALPGNPASEWDVFGAGDASIQGFATEMSVDQGETIFFKVETDAIDYRLDIYRVGYYQGLGARKVATVEPSATLPQIQPAPVNEPETGLVDCGNWSISASWAVPTTATSGVYVAKLVREDPEDGRASHILFVVRDDDGGSDLLLQTNDTTWQAYNTYGGNSLYAGSPAGRAYKVSYNRPFTTRCCDYPGGSILSYFFAAQYPMVRWLEANGYDVSYTTGIDTDRRGGEILDHDVFISVGHDEYWSGDQRANVEAAVDAGVHLAFFSGNEIFWKTRWEPSIDGSGTPYRTLVCYKETHANAKIDPLPDVWTGTWRDPRFSPPADGGRPENELIGTIFTVNGIRNDALQVPEADGKLRLWRNTSVADLLPGEVANFAAGTLGFEWDEDLDNGFRPAGVVRFSTTTVDGVPLIQDYGSNYAPGTATHHFLMHRRPNGAYVYSAGTSQWTWGLDATHDKPGPAADVRIQQATVNLFADLGIQPTTLVSGLVPASPSSDATDPVSVIVSPTSGFDIRVGQAVPVSGTASDVGGRVGGIEISVDSGATWHPAEGRESWSYVWTPQDEGVATLLTRAVDDTGNLESPGSGVTVTVGPAVCPCSLFGDQPGGPIFNDQQPVEVGVRFLAERDGVLRGIRFYKPGPANAGVHVGNLWTNGGTLLNSASFTDESDSGWQEVSFAEGTEVPISASEIYVASVYMPEGNYAATNGYFVDPVSSPPLYALADGEGGFANGIFVYGSGGGFPVNTFDSTNYWVDVIFDTVAVEPPCFVDDVSADFLLGTFDGGVYASETDDGEVILAPAAGIEFFGPGIPSGWSGGVWEAGGVLGVTGGVLTLDGARVSHDTAFGPGRSMEFIATFSGQAFQHVGFSVDGDVNAPWALFSTGTVGGGLYARTSNGLELLIGGSWLGTQHLFRIDWQPTNFQFFIDGAPVATLSYSAPTSMRPVMSELTPGGGELQVDWLRVTPFASSGTFTSRVGDAGSVVDWSTLSWAADTPSGTSILMSARTGDTPAPDGSWSTFAPVGNGGSVGETARYIQYRADLSTSNPSVSPVLQGVTVECGVAAGFEHWLPAGALPQLTVSVRPNPVSKDAEFEVFLRNSNPTGGIADLTIFDVTGREVRTLRGVASGRAPTRLLWNSEDERGHRVAPGVYFYRARVGDSERRGEFVVVR